jgi:hypothetical protein
MDQDSETAMKSLVSSCLIFNKTIFFFTGTIDHAPQILFTRVFGHWRDRARFLTFTVFPWEVQLYSPLR